MTTSQNTPAQNILVSRWTNLTPLGVVITRCEVALAGMFLYAAYQKLFNGENAQPLFSKSVKAFEVLPDMAVPFVTSVTPWIEIVAAGLLLLGIWSRASAAVLSLLLVGFIALIAQALLRGLNVECGCFGDLSPFCPKKVGMCNIVQNAIMLAAGLLITLTPRHLLARTGRPA